MLLTEKHIINYNHDQYKQIDHLCFLSKNLYNATLYAVKQHYELIGKTLRYNDLEKQFRNNLNPDYYALPPNSSQQIMMLMDRNIKSFFKLFNRWKKNPKSLKGCPRMPKYKHKTKGRNTMVFTANQFTIKDGFIHFCKKAGLKPLKTLQISKENIRQIRIVPHSSCYKIEIIYQVNEPHFKDNNNKASIDLGINNLATLTTNTSSESYIINGNPLKSMNQFYNKEKARLQRQFIKKESIKLNKETNEYETKIIQISKTKKVNRLNVKRKNKIDNYLHRASKAIVQLLVDKDISELVIGHNPEWKQNVSLGKTTNQNFVSIPFKRFIDMLIYKCQLAGIKVLTKNEAYTSKCSALDLEPICKQSKYLGSRIKRGLFQTSQGKLINADVNGSLNIGRNAFGNGFIANYISDESGFNRGLVGNPIKMAIQ
jgi:putative transposase